MLAIEKNVLITFINEAILTSNAILISEDFQRDAASVHMKNLNVFP